MNKLKKLPISKKIFISYLFVLFIFMVIFLIYVYNSLLLFERNQIDVYMNNLIEKLKDSSSNNNISKYVDISNLDKEETNESFKSLFKDSKITYKEDKDNYIILSDNNPILRVNIKEGKTVKKLGLLSFKLLSNDKLSIYSKRGIYYYDITVPSNFKVVVNNKELTEPDKEEENEEFKEINIDTFPTDYTYKIDNLIKKPIIEIYDNTNKKIDYEIKDNKIISRSFFNTNDFDKLKDKLIKDIDVYDIAEKWSLYLTNDLDGGRSGFDVINKYLVKDTMMWDRAYDWLVGIDRDFVSKHSFKNPIFTNKSIKDCYLYNDKSFSCLVHLEKNMIVQGKDKIDTMNDRLYFIYLDNSWKLVDMRFVSE